ncbi:oxysterol-binding protein-related protein 8 isoform X3 [Stomoxys calcitrans]|uniref:oxysterol-binding protein-related protein 8 isoform X3 n=1 Tax=Stomoxys calcitrans TaxID=35570 RepID=UPI0027E22ACF|nr:oxysterol-binding protein-related protein 8 isoform X3 [Stomoxys calcitrans]
MAQSSSKTGSNTNLMASGTSTPIRIGSYHGHVSSSGGGGGSDSPTPMAQSQTQSQQSSSVPTSAGHLGQSSASLNMGPSTHQQQQQQQQQQQYHHQQSQPQQQQQQTSSSTIAMSSSVTPPNSAGLRQSGGLANWASDSRDKYDGNQTEKTSSADASKLNRKESYKAQRKNYRREKKRVASELLNSLQDPAVIVLADWLKVRGTLKSWTKLWCVLKPGLLLLYKSPKVKSSHWVGTILLTSCQVIERPSKKDGFCFKLFHPLEQSIWAPRGPDKETIGAVVQPLPTAYLIFRAPSQAAGKCWMDALELSLRCSGLLLRSNSSPGPNQGPGAIEASISHETQWSEADYEKHFNDQEKFQKISRKSQYLTVPHARDETGSTDTSIYNPSRSQTPLLQQLYITMTNWERVVAENANQFKKSKHLPKFRKKLKHPAMDNLDFSEISSADISPKKTSHESLKKKRKHSLSRSSSLRSIGKSSSSSSCSSDEEYDRILGLIPSIMIDSRSVSAPPVDSRLLTYFPLDLDADSQTEAPTGIMSGVDTDSDSDGNDNVVDNQLQAIDNEEPIETPYIPSPEEELNTTSGEQVEELAEENKSLIWCLVKQVRPGMDLSKVVLPTFILEPRSFLDKLSDSYYHADILSRAVLEDDPFTRMKLVVQWYLSGFYKKPKGLKKPYNPILGETYRCYWEHDNGSRTYYIAEQVSHHPPVSAFYVTNRQEGFCISCSILAKSKFYGNSTSAVLEGVATLTLLPRGESYTLTTPYAHCKGILMGTLSMELGGKINIECENTGYKTELEFKLKPFLGGADSTNIVAGKIRLGKETLATISGHWDAEMRIKDAKTGEDSILFAATKDIMKKRLMRYVVPLDSQLPNESERLWNLVSAAIRRDDQVGATEEKTVLEESQRNAAKERKVTFTEWEPLHFQQDIITGKWIYKYADLRPWDPRNDVKQFEWDYKILTKTRHQAPMVRTASIVSVDPMHVIRNCASDQRQSSLAMMKAKRKTKQLTKLANDPNNSDSSQSPDDLNDHPVSSHTVRKLMLAVDQLNNALDDHKRQLVMINAKLERLQYAPPHHTEHSSSFWGVITRTIPQPLVIRALAYAFAALLVSLCLKWLLH